jgi:hypothetical protein
MLKIFIGYDHRQPIAYNILQHSILRHSSNPVAITPLIYTQLPISKERYEKGLTPFTFTRFFVPWLCNYEGAALFLDIDMLLLDDVAKLFDLFDEKYAVQVVNNPGYEFERASMMLFNCAKCKILTPDYINTASNLHSIGWASSEEIGDLPSEWNHLVGYSKPRPNAKLIHYTQGIPIHPIMGDCEYKPEWIEEYQRVNSTLTWETLMGHSVHSAKLPDGRIVPKLTVKA